MRRVLIAIILVSWFESNAYALVSFGLRGGYAYEGLAAKEIHVITKRTIGSTTRITDTTYVPTGEEAETKHPKGFGGELLCEISPPVMPIGVELGAGSYTTSFKELEIDTFVFIDTTIDTTKYTYTMNHIKLSVFGRYFIHGIPMVSPWVGIGPFLGLNALKVKKDEERNITCKGERMSNFGILVGAGARIGMVPKLSFNVGLLFHYFIKPEGKYTQKRRVGNTIIENTSEIKFSQWNINFSVGLSYSIM